jgi:5,10-methylene-tetrahydrofolate dehydrogenase/methenyl tetrahydrofolate cyclohydrolase
MLVTSTPGGTGILTVTALLENVTISWRRKYEAISSPNKES